MKQDQDEEKNKASDSSHVEKPKNEKEPYANQPLPGEYPPAEDIMNRRNETQRANIDPDSLTRTPGAPNMPPEETDDSVAASPTRRRTRTKNESDLTKEDYEALGPRDLSLDGGDDEQLKHRVYPVDFAAKDLDVPNGDDERRDAAGQVDEENDHYSLGGDDKENLEEDPTRTLG
jgi:hypothetical protein